MRAGPLFGTSSQPTRATIGAGLKPPSRACWPACWSMLGGSGSRHHTPSRRADAIATTSVFNDSVDFLGRARQPDTACAARICVSPPGWFGPGISLDPRSSNADLGGKCVRARRQLPRCSTRSRPYSPPRSSTTSGCRPYRSKSRCNRPYPARQQRGHVARRRPPNNPRGAGSAVKGAGATPWRYRNAGRSPPSRPPWATMQLSSAIQSARTGVW